jgi:hypothetical protein
VVVLSAKLRRIRPAAAHSLDAEGLPVRLATHDHRHQVITGVGDVRAGAAKATTATAAATNRWRIHSDERPDAADRIERGITRRSATACAAPTTTASRRRGNATTTGSAGKQRRRRRVETTRATATTAATTTR